MMLAIERWIYHVRQTWFAWRAMRSGMYVTILVTSTEPRLIRAGESEEKQEELN